MSSRISPWARWRRRSQARRLRALHISYRFWHNGIRELRACDHLDPNQRRRLRVLCGAFLAGKRCVGARRFPVDDRMRLLIAILACLPILELGLAWLRGVREVVIYPGTFLVDREAHDEAGVVHREQREMAGEAWEQGPVILSWGDFVRDAAVHGLDEGLVLHEFAHKLDMLSGEATGRPPLPQGMRGDAWEQAFTPAFRALRAAVKRGEDTVLDPYGSESPAEFFSVCSEAFFLRPRTLKAQAPRVYAQLHRFYRQDPAAAFSTCVDGR